MSDQMAYSLLYESDDQEAEELDDEEEDVEDDDDDDEDELEEDDDEEEYFLFAFLLYLATHPALNMYLLLFDGNGRTDGL